MRLSVSMGKEFGMDSRYAAIGVAFVTIIFCITLPGSVCRAAEPGFAVDSYIPDYFRDFEWRVDGGMLLAGPENQQVRLVPLPREGDTRSTHSIDQQMLEINSSFKYRYRTIPRFLTVTMGMGARYDHANSFSSAQRTYPGDFIDYDNAHQNDHAYDFRIYPSFDAGTYVIDDIFISMVSRILYRTGGTFSGKESYHNENYDLFAIDTAYLHISDGTRDRTNDLKSYSADAALMPGWGRVYEGNFAATALYMVDELSREGLLEREPTANEMRELCDLIYYYRLKHPVDSRLLKIDALRHVMDLFIGNDLITDPGPYGYLLIQDVWDYFPRWERLFGFRFRCGPGIEYSSYRTNESMDVDEHTRYQLHTPDGDVDMFESDHREVYSTARKDEFRGTYVKATAEYHKPLDIRWQFDGVVDASYYPNAHEFTNIIRQREVPPYTRWQDDTYIVYTAMYDISASGGIEYILNSRTSSRLTAGYIKSHYNSAIQYSYSRYGYATFIDPITRDDRELDEVIVEGTLTYRLSIPTTLTINAVYRNRSQNVYQEDTDDWDSDEYWLSVRLSHYLY